ncbi:transposase [Mycoavidus sp. B2-EB]|nr:integrase core domain-containing protein [Mycoavidus sp. B2-EB]BBO60306.1 transposase [Mycoavidus sp. B2-EB]
MCVEVWRGSGSGFGNLIVKVNRCEHWQDKRRARQTDDRGLVVEKPDAVTAANNLAIAFEHYNEQHPHSALQYRSPREFRKQINLVTQI